ncbi:hypothetical protein WG66_006649 [Moniliophthora roreri]|nr:hypothetical protein WG66_006649 [Moniliophthora roreri]
MIGCDLRLRLECRTCVFGDFYSIQEGYAVLLALHLPRTPAASRQVPTLDIHVPYFQSYQFWDLPLPQSGIEHMLHILSMRGRFGLLSLSSKSKEALSLLDIITGAMRKVENDENAKYDNTRALEWNSRNTSQEATCYEKAVLIYISVAAEMDTAPLPTHVLWQFLAEQRYE